MPKPMKFVTDGSSFGNYFQFKRVQEILKRVLRSLWFFERVFLNLTAIAVVIFRRSGLRKIRAPISASVGPLFCANLICIAMFGVVGVPIQSSQAQTRNRSTVKVPRVLTAEQKLLERKTAVNKRFVQLAQLYLTNKIKQKDLWLQLAQLEETGLLDSLAAIHTLQIQGDLLYQAKLPVIGATYAAQALKGAEDPLSSRYYRAWKILRDVSLNHPIQFILEDLAMTVPLHGRSPKYFGNDWNYIIANGLAQSGYDQKAEDFYQRINMSSRYFMPSRYQIAMINYDKGDFKNALGSLKSILLPSTREVSPLNTKDQLEMLDYANMAIGRIKYEQKEFLDSSRYFRKVRKISPLFYDSLYEQSWSLFMSGNPKHSLGTLYGASSTFFKDNYNPEAKVLESIVYFWMCRYGDARNSLADFAESYAQTMNALSNILGVQKLTSTDAYDLFENLISGVSSRSLGIPREVLTTAARRDTMLLIRDQLATVMYEYGRLRDKGLFGTKNFLKEPLRRITIMRTALKSRLGDQFIKEIEAEKAHYIDLYSQAEFLYLELLMSEKEQLLGRELHAQMKVDRVSDYEDIRGWGRDTQSWKSEAKGEYWWDEIGFHLVDVEPQCLEGLSQN